MKKVISKRSIHPADFGRWLSGAKSCKMTIEEDELNISDDIFWVSEDKELWSGRTWYNVKIRGIPTYRFVKQEIFTLNKE